MGRHVTHPWYKIEYTVFNDGMWYIAEYWTESIRKANKFLKEHLDGKLKLVYR